MNFQITPYPSYSSSSSDNEWGWVCDSPSSYTSEESSIQSENGAEHDVCDIDSTQLSISLESLGYPERFFMPLPEKHSLKDQEWEIRDEANANNRLEKFAEAAKLCIKLFVNSLNKPEDTKLLNSVVFNLLNKPCMGTTDFTFNEIQVIINSCKNAEFSDKTERFNNNNLCTHLISRTNPLVQDIVNITQKATLLLKLNAVGKSDFAKLPPEIIKMIAKQYSDMIIDICNTHVDISRAQLFPKDVEKRSSNT